MIFQKLILTIAIISLIVILVVIGIALSKANAKTIWPPIVSECPDYWIDMSGNGEACLNIHNLNYYLNNNFKYPYLFFYIFKSLCYGILIFFSLLFSKLSITFFNP